MQHDATWKVWPKELPRTVRKVEQQIRNQGWVPEAWLKIKVEKKL